jgi:hypothetical protein
VLTDQAAMLAIRPHAGVPIARLLVRSGDQDLPAIRFDAGNNHSLTSARCDTAVGSESGDASFSLGVYEVQLAPGFESERNAVVEAIGLMAPHVDLGEPFGRIHEAIREAQRIGGRTLEGHGQAA